VEHGEPGGLQRSREAPRVAGGGRDEAHTRLDDEVDEVARLVHEELRDVDPKGPVGEVAHLANLAAYHVELARRRLDDAKAAGLRHRRGQLRTSDVAHRSLDDGPLDAEHLGDPVDDAWLVHGCIVAQATVRGLAQPRSGRRPAARPPSMVSSAPVR